MLYNEFGSYHGLLYNTAWFLALWFSESEEWSCIMRWRGDISLDTIEYYDLWKYENFCMDDCGNMDQYSLKHQLSCQPIVKSTNLLNKQKRWISTHTFTPLDLAVIEESVIEIFGLEKIAKTGLKIYITLWSSQRQI